MGRGSGASPGPITSGTPGLPGGSVLIEDFGGGTDATAAENKLAIDAAIAMTQVAGNGVVYWPTGTVRTTGGHLVEDSVHHFGYGTTVLLEDSSNNDLFISRDFATLTGGTTRGGPEDWSFNGMILDGNKANNTSGYVLKVFGAAYRLNDIEIQNGASGGWWSEWGTGGTDMEAQCCNVRVHDNNNKGVDWQGPHDSVFVNVIVFKNSTHGFHFRGNATSEQLLGCHIWGNEHDYGVYADTTCYMENTQIEGATVANLRVHAANVCVIGGAIFGTGGANEVGVEIGDGTVESIGGTIIKGTSMRAFNGASAFAFKINGATPAGSDIDVTYFSNGATAAISGTFNDTNNVVIRCNDVIARSQESRHNIYGRVRFIPAASSTTSTTWKSSDGVTDHLNFNSSSQRLELVNGTDIRVFSDNYTTQVVQIDGAGFIDITEITAPSAPSTNRGRLFMQDNGAGKTQLCVRFPTGATQIIATEP